MYGSLILKSLSSSTSDVAISFSLEVLTGFGIATLLGLSFARKVASSEDLREI